MGLLFDVSHAMYAFEQTLADAVAHGASIGAASEDLDHQILESLFNDDRSINRIGGLDASGLLPCAISIGRLRRRGASWYHFAKSVNGLKSLEHHKSDKIRVVVGKQRRGRRLRQRYWLTSDLVGLDGDEKSSLSARSNIIPCSSPATMPVHMTNDTEKMELSNKCAIVIDQCSEYLRLLDRTSGTKGITISKSPGKTSWGVGLVKEADVCVVGSVRNPPNMNSGDTNFLICGDLILFAQNEDGQVAFSPATGTVSREMVQKQLHGTGDWYRSMVNLFKNSRELHLIVRRVG
mmetsp:Transcript_1330/g.2412  ORF Transcript_1330/g.2412 Transcript_1330/m.2412 type:complete len:292 (+) Transcript_1330:904-1779(+)